MVICNTVLSAMRNEASENSEMISQILYGEAAEILERKEGFVKIKMAFDGAEGWCNGSHFTKVQEEKPRLILSQNFGIYELPEGRSLLSIGSEVDFSLEDFCQKTNTSQRIAEKATEFLNVPFLYGGRSFFGTDGTGFIQLIFKIHGISLPRTAEKMAEHGEILDFIHESQPGDLAFFEDNFGKIIHAGIIADHGEIIHCTDRVKRDQLDSAGIFNQKTNSHSHKLRFIKRIIS